METVPSERASVQQSSATGALAIRLISAAVLIPVALGVVWFGGWVLAAFLALALLQLVIEWSRVTEGRVRPAQVALMALVGFGALSAAALASGIQALGILSLGAVIVAGLSRVFDYGAFWSFCGTLILAGAACLFLLLRQWADGLELVLWLFIIVWTTDTGAYAAGKLIGGPAFAPQLSPNKTWAGLLGGIVLAILAALASVVLFPGLLAPGTLTGSLGLAAAAAMLISAGGQIGDILESTLKRRFHVKDSGGLIPGHGGLLDRLDGFLVAVAVLAALRGLNVV